jgi:hypothetical protein
VFRSHHRAAFPKIPPFFLDVYKDQKVPTMGRKFPDVTFCKCPNLGVWEAYASNRVAYGVSFVCPLILRPRRSVLVQAAFG